MMRGATKRQASDRRCALLLMGPTGGGKSDLAVRLASTFPFEIVSVDSAQVYRGMDIGTAKPDAQTRKAIAHHLIDIRDPATSYSAGEFVRDASDAMHEIWQRGRQPLLVGGTMLYFHALTWGLAQLPEADLGVRAQIDALALPRRAGARCTRNCGESIPRRPRGSMSMIRSAFSGRWKCIE